MSQIAATHASVPLVTRRARRPAAAVAAFAALFTWIERARSRRQLAELDDRMLADIGLDRATARTEADRPFWQESDVSALEDTRRAIWYVR